MRQRDAQQWRGGAEGGRRGGGGGVGARGKVGVWDEVGKVVTCTLKDG